MLARVFFAWFVAVAISALGVFILVALGLLGPTEAESSAETWIAVALLTGFLAGGFVAGVRGGEAPVLDGLAIAVISLVAWLLANLIFSVTADLSEWSALSLTATAALLLLQAVAAVVGARLGVRWRRGARSVA